MEDHKMKRNAILIGVLLTLIFVIPATAQKVSVGLVGGVNFADMNLTSADGTDQLTSSITTPAFGVTVDLELTNYLHLDIEPMYIQKGGIQKATNGNPDATLKINMLEVPVFLKATLGNKVKPYIKVGPTFGLVVSSKAEANYSEPGPGQSKTYTANYNDVLGSFEFGVCAAAGIDFKVGKSTLFIDARYSVGLRDLYKGGTIEWKSGDEIIVVKKSGATKLTTKGIQVMVGIAFPIGKEKE